MKKATLNLVVDSAVALAFALSAVSGVVFLLPQPASTVPTVLGLDLLVWNDLHTVASLGTIGGVLLHLALHARWVAATARKTFAETFGAKKRDSVRRASCPTVSRTMTGETPVVQGPVGRACCPAREATSTAKRGLA